MSYAVRFPTASLEKQFGKVLSKIPDKNLRLKIVDEVEKLGSDPFPEGKKFKFLRPPVDLFAVTATCRLRIGDYRVLYDVDEEKKTVWVLALRRRSEKTYD